MAALRPDWCFEPMEDVGHVPQVEDAPRFVERVVRWMNEALPGKRPDPIPLQVAPPLSTALAVR